MDPSTGQPASSGRSLETTRGESRWNLQAMLADGVFYSVMVGIGETYLPAFTLAIGLGELASGLITSIPLLVGAFLQLIAPWLVARIGSYRRFMMLGTTAQTIAFIPLIFSAWTGSIGLIPIFLVVSVYWGAGMAINPAWNTWAEVIVPRHLRASYFARRTRYSQAGTLIGFLAGGMLLQVATNQGWRLQAFGILFAVAALARTISAAFLASQTDAAPTERNAGVSPGTFLRRCWNGGNESLIVYLVTMQLMVYISGPYFTPFMLGQLKFGYFQFASLVAISFLAKMISLPLWGYVARQYGARSLLWIGGIGIVPIAAMWVGPQNYAYFAFLQFTGGVVWAAYELAMLLLFFETISKNERTSILSYYHFGNAVAIGLGSLIGGIILSALGEQINSYLFLFALSSVGRGLTIFQLWRLPKFQIEKIPEARRKVVSCGGEEPVPVRGNEELVPVRGNEELVPERTKPILPAFAVHAPETNFPIPNTASRSPQTTHSQNQSAAAV